MPKLSAVFLMFFLAIPAVAAEFAVSLHGRDDLVLAIPDGWIAQVRLPRPDLPPTVTVTSSAGDAIQVLITPVWPIGNAKIPAPDQVKSLVEGAAKEAQPRAVERSLPLQKITGRDANGYYFSATDRQPGVGGYKYQTQGVIVINELSVMFTVLHNDKTQNPAEQALEMLRTAHRAPARDESNQKHSPIGSSSLRCSTTDRSPAHADVISKASLDEVSNCAAKNDAVAQNHLGVLYGTGKQVALDSKKSFEFYRAAALSGYTQAKANLAYMYFNGEGVERDYEKAYKWSEEAAIEGSAQAQQALGHVHATGTGGAKSGKLAEKWFLASAEQGNLSAQKSLIKLYSDGELVPKNPRKASLWTHRVRDAVLNGQVWRKWSE